MEELKWGLKKEERKKPAAILREKNKVSQGFSE